MTSPGSLRQNVAFVSRSDSLLAMFDDRAFHSWPLILGGAALFAALFALLALMTEFLFEGSFRVTVAVVGFGVAAFVGYVGTAMILRQGRPPSG